MARPTRLLAALLTLIVLLHEANGNALAIWGALRNLPAMDKLSQVAGLALGYGHTVFIAGLKSRAVQEMFSGVDEVKQCLQHPVHRRSGWAWRKHDVDDRRDWSGCITGPSRFAAAVYLIKADMTAWLFPGRKKSGAGDVGYGGNMNLLKGE